MNFSKAQVAALVLGYLRREKFVPAAEAFLRCCSYLLESDEVIKWGKSYCTRVGGLTLTDYLKEYSEIYAIVQTHIEDTDCYEHYDRPTLVQQILFLLNKHQPVITTSTPVLSAPCELDATQAYELPGNSTAESDSSIPKTPKKRSNKSKSKENDDVVDMAEVLAQSLLGKHELHEKIAETINTVMNTPEVTKTVSDEHISAGASKELDAVIKTVIQRTEEDPLYNKLIDEIIGASSCDNPKKLLPCSTPTTSLNIEETPTPQSEATSTQNPPTDPMDDHNNHAVRSIIEAAQNTDPPPAPPQPEPTAPPKNEPHSSGEVYVFDGNLDTYLKTSGVTNAINPNPVYFNPGGLIIVPPPETAKQFYVVNNQPLLKVNVPVVTEKELMSMPTVIVNDENPSTTAPCVDKSAKRSKTAKTKGSESVAAKTKVSDGVTVEPKSESVPAKNKVTEGLLIPASRENVVITRQASHVRNLDFSTPSCKSDGNKPQKKEAKLWDEDLRMLVGNCKDKSPSPKKKRPTTAKKKSKKVEEKPPQNEKQEEIEKKNVAVEEREHAGLMTPEKDCVPKTPGGTLDTSSLHCTPFTAVLEQQLEGVDINSIPTPSIPITPGFALTPGDMLGPNQRLTDYSTSSSYYQPSDTEQKTTMTDLIEESKKLDSLTPTKQEKPSNVNILSNVILEKNKNSLIGKKNLNLIKRTVPSSSSESESESDVETTNGVNKTILTRSNSSKKHNNTAAIKEIINNVEVKNTLDEETRKKNLQSHLEEVRQRTVQKLINAEESKKQRAKPARKKLEKTPKTPKVTRKYPKKKATSTEENTDEEAQRLVTDLAQRGIHLVHNKTPHKKTEVKKVAEPCVNENEDFDRRTYEDCEVVLHETKSLKRRSIKSYDTTVLNKSMTANVFIDELNTEVQRVIKWTDCDCILDNMKEANEEFDELMDYCIVGSVREESPDVNETKCGRKRKYKFTDDDRNKDKKNKPYENDLRLLKKIDVDDFLNKVHGE